MPKTSRDRSISFEKSRKSPFHCSSSLSRESKPTVEDLKEWEDVRCPVCIEHPHNAVLLICSSYHKGCRPYMCDTSYRHSNCLDQFRKSFTEETPVGVEAFTEETPSVGNQTHAESSQAVAVGVQDEGKYHGSIAMELLSSMHKLEKKLVCPLCRGQISGWVVVDLARDFMNSKSRSCACETCDYTGTYSDLRKHARSEHPEVRPSVADPERQSSWRHLERQRDIGDVLSTIQSSFGDDHDHDHNHDDDAILPLDDRGWITIFFFFRFLRPPTSQRSGSSSGSWSGTSRARTRAQTRARRRSTRSWGESHEPEPSSNPVEDEDSSDGGLMTWQRRVRRRLPTPDDDEI